MGFFITGDISNNDYVIDKVGELKQHVNLSEFAWNIIEQDMRNFSVESETSFSGFMNNVFSNFYSEAMASISQRYVEKSDQLNIFFSSNEFMADTQIKELYVAKLLASYEKELLNLSASYPKGIGKKFRINKANLDILRESSESIYYDDNIGRYLKAIFEEYCSKPNYIREQIFFKRTKDTICSSIAMRNKIHLTILQKYNPKENRYYSRKFIVSPYKLLQDEFMSFNYLVCKAEELLPDGRLGEEKIASFRLNRIEKVSPRVSASAFLSKAEKNEIDETIVQKGLQFLAGDLIDVKVRFTKKGLESLNRQIYMRPHIYRKLSTDTYQFTCTELQASNYFFKFGIDAQIIEPLDLREKFINRYKAAISGYTTENV